MRITHYTLMDSPIGELLLAGDNQGLSLIAFAEKNKTHNIESHWLQSDTHFTEAVNQLEQYFNGQRQSFSISTHMVGTKFQMKVIKELTQIPYGKTCSYAELAVRVGHPRAYRAVGSANGKNPLPIIYPCHRVIASNGSLGGYSGGLRIKTALLTLESRV
ncbi:MAG: methylated-DNA--[protein]-cysteine S-methyltransferase [Woeseiaceae bacterium]|jgi:methylated-DNA-[protein]-cysteine S-methyltransferase|nr:methylated-DNA--[protein]-cysteine S-methyltransferase [Woeseiaceae bacterium]MDG1865062.1 methylated-DNA--[protein]-cysteine S-methyltransferase [Woeseiaceae bacterium]